jgi:uncharacterized membrane protein YdbT with pleckstrin-like domain
MGRYIDEILQPGEKVLFSTNAHWIFFLPAILLWILAAALFVASGLIPGGGPLVLVCWALAGVVALVALYKTVTAWFHRWTTETDVTNFRVVHKTGFITRTSKEISLDKIASVDVEQSIMGRIFNYGDVTLATVGGGDDEDDERITTIASPLVFRNSITAR